MIKDRATHSKAERDARPVCLIASEEIAASSELREAVEELRETCPIEVRFASGASEARDLVRKAAGEEYRAVVAAGGDGSLSLAASGFLACEDVRAGGLAVAPLGTANDFASLLGLTSDNVIDALRLAANGKPSLIDAGRLDGSDRFFVNVASGGFAAEVTAEANPALKEVFGGFAYFLTGINRLSELQARPAKLRGPDFEWSGNLYALCVGNGRRAGGGYNMCPGALLDDGLFDITIIPELPFPELVRIGQEIRLLDGERHSVVEGVENVRLAWVEVDAPDGLQVNLDGEPLNQKKFRFDLLHKCLPFYLPENAPVSAPGPKA